MNEHKETQNIGRVPYATEKNHVLVGGVGTDYSYAVYNPHNARFYFAFDSSTLNQGVGGLVLESMNVTEKGLKDFLGCRFVIKKSQIEVTNKIDKERRFIIKGSLDDRRAAVIDAVATMEMEVIERLKQFVAIFGGKTNFICLKSWIPDNKILHDRIIDSLPFDLNFRNEVVKKVYNTEPLNVEVSSPALASNMFRNLALFDVAPEISSKLNDLLTILTTGGRGVTANKTACEQPAAIDPRILDYEILAFKFDRGFL